MNIIQNIFKKISNLSYKFGTIIFYNENNEITENINETVKIFIKPKKWLISYHEDDKTFHIYVQKLDSDFKTWFEKIKNVINTFGYSYTLNILGNPVIGRKKKEIKKEKNEKMKEDYLETPKKIKKKEKIAKKLIDLLAVIDIDNLIKLLNKLKNRSKDGKEILFDKNQILSEKILEETFKYYFNIHDYHYENLSKDVANLFESNKEIFLENNANLAFSDIINNHLSEDYSLLKKIYQITENCNCDMCGKMNKFVKNYISNKTKLAFYDDNPIEIPSQIKRFFNNFKTDDIVENIFNKEEKIIENIKRKELYLKQEENHQKEKSLNEDFEFFKETIKKIIEYKNNPPLLENVFKWMNKEQKARLNNILEEYFIDLSREIKSLLYENCDCENQIKEIYLSSRPKDEKNFLYYLKKIHGEHVSNKCKRLFIGQPLNTVHPKTLKIISLFAKAIGETNIAEEIEKYLKYLNDEIEWTENETVYSGPIDQPDYIRSLIIKEGNNLIEEQFLNILNKQPLEHQSFESLRFISKICEEQKEIYLSTFIEKYLSRYEDETL